MTSSQNDASANENSGGGSPGRAELLHAAAQVFANRGYMGATTTAIAQLAGVSQPLLYHHFGSKKGLWTAVINEIFGGLRLELERVALEFTGATRTERLTALLSAFVRFSGEHPELARLIHTESSGGGEAFDELYQRWVADLVAFFEQEISAAQQDHTIRSLNSAALYFVIVGAATEPFIQPQIAGRTFGVDTTSSDFIETYCGTVVEVLLRGVLAEPR